MLSFGTARASLVSRLGEVYLYDPLTFDAGGLQRGGWVRGGAGTDGGGLDVGLETTFFRDFSARLGYRNRFIPGAENGLDITWRFRFPVIESARYRHFTSSQFYYRGQHSFEAVDDSEPSHEFGGAESTSFPVFGAATSLHVQMGVAIRPSIPLADDVTAARVGAAFRFAWLFQLYHPSRGRAGLWTVTYSVLEASSTWFGWPGTSRSGGRLLLTAGAPAIHFAPRGVCYTLGLSPQVSWHRGPNGTTMAWSGMVTLAVSQRRGLE